MAPEHRAQQGDVPAIVIVLPDLPPSPNRLRGHPVVVWRETHHWRDAVTLLARVQRPDKPFLQATVRIVLVRKGGQPRDPDNLVASCKMLIDGLKIGGVLADDSPQHIILQVEQEVGSRRETVITVRPAATMLSDLPGDLRVY